MSATATREMMIALVSIGLQDQVMEVRVQDGGGVGTLTDSDIDKIDQLAASVLDEYVAAAQAEPVETAEGN